MERSQKDSYSLAVDDEHAPRSTTAASPERVNLNTRRNGISAHYEMSLQGGLLLSVTDVAKVDLARLSEFSPPS
jgi:hypothetical protein